MLSNLQRRQLRKSRGMQLSMALVDDLESVYQTDPYPIGSEITLDFVYANDELKALSLVGTVEEKLDAMNVAGMSETAIRYWFLRVSVKRLIFPDGSESPEVSGMSVWKLVAVDSEMDAGKQVSDDATSESVMESINTPAREASPASAADVFLKAVEKSLAIPVTYFGRKPIFFADNGALCVQNAYLDGNPLSGECSSVEFRYGVIDNLQGLSGDAVSFCKVANAADLVGSRFTIRGGKSYEITRFSMLDGSAILSRHTPLHEAIRDNF